MNYQIDSDWLRANKLEPARYSYEGEMLWVPVVWSDGIVHLVTAKVVCAAGNHVRMVNEKRILDRWYDVWDVYRKSS